MKRKVLPREGFTFYEEGNIYCPAFKVLTTTGKIVAFKTRCCARNAA
jgi:hypothetical protein